MSEAEYEELILKHYRKIANNNGLTGRSTMEDQYIRNQEVEFILEQIKAEVGAKTLLDAGCGNGFVLSRIRETFPDLELYGVEFTPELFELAQSRALSQTNIRRGDIRDRSHLPDSVDVVLTERVVINILDRKHQYQALHNIADCLRPGGLYIQIESYREPLVELNHARKECVIEPINESYQNMYLYERMVEHMESRMGLKEIEGVRPPNQLSTHFYVSRVLHQVIRPEGGKVKYARMTEFLVKAMPPAVGNYSPILFRVFRKLG